MPLFLDKSEQSKQAAELLAKNSLYSSAVNRAYYWCIQYMLYVLYEKLQHEGGAYYANKKAHEGSHSYVTRLIGDYLAKQNRSDYKWYQAKVKEFKALRVMADYFPDTISSDSGLTSIADAKAIIGCINGIKKS